MNTENYTVSESEEILREIKQTTDKKRLEELWDEYYEAARYEYEERFGVNYVDALKKVMKKS
jgi:predicted solute-binding protein